MGSVLALALRQRGCAVTLVTPAGRAVVGGAYTDKQQSRIVAMMQAGVTIVTNTTLAEMGTEGATLACV